VGVGDNTMDNGCIPKPLVHVIIELEIMEAVHAAHKD
jgi:hypothetical protein